MGWRRFRILLRKAFQFGDSPESVGRGVAVGLFIGMTPTMGIQMILAGLAALAFRANRLAAITVVWITNPLTVVPVYWLDYQIGIAVLRLFLPVEEISWGRFEGRLVPAAEGEFLDVLRDYWSLMLEVGGRTVVPLFLGGILLGLVFAFISYPIVVRIAARRRARRILKGVHLKEDVDNLNIIKGIGDDLDGGGRNPKKD